MSDSAVQDTTTQDSPATPSAPAVSAAESKADAMLDAMMAQADGQKSLAPVDKEAAPAPEDVARERDEHGRFVSSKTEEQPESDDDNGKDSRHTDDEVRRAVSALQRYGAPKSVLKQVEAGDPDVLAYGLKQAKIQDDADAFTKKHKTLQQELDNSKKPAQPKDQQVEPTAFGDKLAKQLAETIGLDESDPLAGVVRESFAGQHKSFQDELAKRDEQLASMRQQVEAMAIDRARDALITEYPDLKDRGVWEKVKATFADLPESESRPDLVTRLEHAARIELAPELAKRARDERAKRSKMRDDGTPSSPSRPGPSTAPKVDLNDEYLDAMEKNDTARVKEIEAELKARQRR